MRNIGTDAERSEPLGIAEGNAGKVSSLQKVMCGSLQKHVP